MISFFSTEYLPVFPVLTEATASLSRGATAICSSTLEKLRGFTCLSEPSIHLSYSERDQEKHERFGEKVIRLKSQVPSPPNAAHQPINSGSCFQPEQENEDEEDDEQEEQSSRKVSTKKVIIADITCLAMCLLCNSYLFMFLSIFY